MDLFRRKRSETDPQVLGCNLWPSVPYHVTLPFPCVPRGMVEVVSPQRGRDPPTVAAPRTRNQSDPYPIPTHFKPLPPSLPSRLTLSTSSFQSFGDHNRTGQQGREGAPVSRGVG